VQQSAQIADPQSEHLAMAGFPHGIPTSLSLDTYSIWQNGFIAHENAPDSVKSWRAFVTASPPSSDLSDALEAEEVAYSTYSRNPFDRNSCCGTSIGGNFNCSLAPICASNFK
jgi:hypothetical protein